MPVEWNGISSFNKALAGQRVELYLFDTGLHLHTLPLAEMGTRLDAVEAVDTKHKVSTYLTFPARGDKPTSKIVDIRARFNFHSSLSSGF
ncbi:hypothetical protein CSOJ01_09388 [Colletotrichum sojae]|uniref:Uncharacterized protein n=1 Tax=Colletotrichum sojae TaxID=2175907 RepID=A0A8H6J325_9PEZI|nr:hypothetical protein CSOJ01_09388 [Colletotrichum sojae]